MKLKEKPSLSSFASKPPHLPFSKLSFDSEENGQAIPNETSPLHHMHTSSVLHDSFIKSKENLDSKGISHAKTAIEFRISDKNIEKNAEKNTEKGFFKSKGRSFEQGKIMNKALNIKNEKFIEESMQEIKRKLDDNVTIFEEKLKHELSIILFLEDCFPTLETMRNNNKNELFAVFGLILSKYLYTRVTFIKFSLEKLENFMGIDDWNIVKINALLPKKVETFAKKQLKYEENMRFFAEESKGFITKDLKLRGFLTKEADFCEDFERVYKKSFLTVFMGISEYLEKGKKHGASKYCYAFILRMYYFLIVYIRLGFFQMDALGKIEVKDWQESLSKMCLEDLKNEIIKMFKSIY